MILQRTYQFVAIAGVCGMLHSYSASQEREEPLQQPVQRHSTRTVEEAIKQSKTERDLAKKLSAQTTNEELEKFLRLVEAEKWLHF